MDHKKDPRLAEAELLELCAQVCLGSEPATATNQVEANFMDLAYQVIDSEFPAHGLKLRVAADVYFQAHPQDRLEPGEVIRRGWVIGLPRLRSMLSVLLKPPAP